MEFYIVETTRLVRTDKTSEYTSRSVEFESNESEGAMAYYNALLLGRPADSIETRPLVSGGETITSKWRLDENGGVYIVKLSHFM